MMVNRTHAYKASEELATRWITYAAALEVWWAELRVMPDPAPGLQFAYNNDWTGYELFITGFLPLPKQESTRPPEGLRRPNPRRTLLVPYKDARGDHWRDLLNALPKPPKISAALEKLYGIRDATIDSGRGDFSSYMVWPKFEIFDDKVYVTTAAEHPPTEHLEPIKMSEYYAAKEATASE